MRINNWRHVPWIIFVVLATFAAGLLYVGNFHPDRMPAGIHMPPSLIQTPTEHHTVGGTPLGLWFGSISLGIFIFAALLSLRKKIPLWRVGTVQRWLRAHIWLTLLTIPLIILHSGFRLGGPMTTLLMALYAIVMVSGIYGLFLQHLMPRLMKERLPAETVFEQIPHIRGQLAVAAEKMRDSFKPAPPKKPDAAAPSASPAKVATAGAPVMASTKGELSTPAARAKSATGSAVTAEPVAAANAAAEGKKEEEPPKPGAKEAANSPRSAANAAVTPAPPKAETIGTPTARVQSDPPGAPVPRAEVPAGDEPAPSPPIAPATAPAAAEKRPSDAAAVATSPTPAPAPTPPKAPAPAAAKPAAPKPAAAAAKPPAKPAPPPDPASEEALVEFIDRQILPYLRARRGDRMRLGNPRFSDDTFRFVKLRVTETYRSRVEEIQAWCDERRMLDLQTRLHHWLHGWLFVHVPFSFLLLLLTLWHAYVALFYY